MDANRNFSIQDSISQAIGDDRRAVLNRALELDLAMLDHCLRLRGLACYWGLLLVAFESSFALHDFRRLIKGRAKDGNASEYRPMRFAILRTYSSSLRHDPVALVDQTKMSSPKSPGCLTRAEYSQLAY